MKARHFAVLFLSGLAAGCATVRPRPVSPYPVDMAPGLEGKLRAYGRTMDDVRAWAAGKGISEKALDDSRYVFASYMLSADRPIDAAKCAPSIVGFQSSGTIDGSFEVSFRIRSGETDLLLDEADPVYLSSLVRCSTTLRFADRLVPRVFLETKGEMVSATLKLPEETPSAFFRIAIDPD